jgi:hypothetical protein
MLDRRTLSAARAAAGTDREIFDSAKQKPADREILFSEKIRCASLSTSARFEPGNGSIEGIPYPLTTFRALSGEGQLCLLFVEIQFLLAVHQLVYDPFQIHRCLIRSLYGHLLGGQR